MPTPRIFLGLLLIVVGGLLLLDRAGTLDAGTIIGRWWPVAIIGAGALQLTEPHRSRVVPLIVIAVGALLLLTQLDVVPGSVWRYAWPVALILLGALFVLRRGGGAVRGANPDSTVQATAFFSGNEIVNTSQAFRGGSLTAAFGGVQLDLRQAQLDPAGADLNATALFGGAEILVPRGWHVEMRGVPIFGGTANKAEPAADPTAPTLRVEATAVFGGVEVKHQP